MKKIKILSLLFCVVMLVAACHDDEEGPIIPQPREQVGRTVLVYIVGDNGVNELSDLFKTNFEDMKEGMKEVDYSKCRFFVKFGGTSSIVNKESWLSVVCFLPYCTSAFLPL